MKSCFKCGAERPLSDFYKHKQMRDGHLNKCIDCTKKGMRDRRFDPEKRATILEYDRQRGNRQDNEYVKSYRKQNPEKHMAHRAVYAAIKSGQLVRPESCEQCNEVGAVHGHHDDYSKPLEVRWLCPPCHRQHHAMEESA